MQTELVNLSDSSKVSLMRSERVVKIQLREKVSQGLDTSGFHSAYAIANYLIASKQECPSFLFIYFISC